MVVGSVFVGVAFLLLVALVLIEALRERPIPKQTRHLVLLLFALSLGAGSEFLGSYGSVEGKIPLPYATSNPLEFSVVGGVAVTLIVWIIGYYVYIRPAGQDDTPDPTVTESSVAYPAGTRLSDAITEYCSNQKPKLGVRFEPTTQPFDTRFVALGEVRGKSVIEIVERLTMHLSIQ